MVTDRLQSVLEGHQNNVVGLRFTQAGSLLISSAWDGTVRVWDPVRGTPLLTVRAGLVETGPDDRQVVLRDQETRFGLWELADGRECRALHHGMVGNRTPRPDGWGPHTLDFSPDGRLLASSDVDGVRLWDPSSGTPLAYLPLDAVGASALFSPDGSHLMTSCDTSDSGPRIWPLRAGGDGTEGGLQIGPPRFLTATKGLYWSHGAWDRTGRYVMVDAAARTQAALVDVVRSAEVARVGPHRGLDQCPISPDGRWVATATWKGKDVNVWEVATGNLAWQFPCDSAKVKFSPDGRWLAVIAFPKPECRLWHVGSWRPGPVIQVSSSVLPMAFSRDGRLLAIDDSGRVRLVEPDSGREVATLDDGTSAHFFCLAFSPDGSHLAAGRDHIIHLWDLRRIRGHLAALGLDWDAPPYPPPGQAQPLGPVVLVSSPDNQAQMKSIDPAPSRIDGSGKAKRPQ
jgi:WD40 repeat protein